MRRKRKESNMAQEFYVVMTHNFDPDNGIYKFQDEETAKEFLLWLWEDYYNTEIAEGSYLDEDLCYHEDDYAIVKWVDGCYTEFKLVEGTDTVPKEFWKGRKK